MTLLVHLNETVGISQQRLHRRLSIGAAIGIFNRID
jgi:hypothetical protein